VTFNPLVLTDARIYVSGADLTGYSNKIMMAAKSEDLDATTFASGGWKERRGGVADGQSDIEGLWAAGDLTAPDDVFFTNLGSRIPLSAIPTLGTVGSLAYLVNALDCQYQQGGKHGVLNPFSASLPTSGPIARGAVLHPQGTARTTTGSGTSVQLGAVDSNHALYVNLHQLGFTDGSMTVTVQSDNATGFPSSATQGTFTAVTALGGQTMKIAGPVTDDWWRVGWTISGGSTHSFLFAVTAGIGPK
jgi:hypothetical protein